MKGNKNLKIPVLENHEFLQSKDFLEKPRPCTFQMGSRLSLEIKNKNIHVLDCEKSIVQYALYYLTLLILKYFVVTFVQNYGDFQSLQVANNRL